MESGFPLIPLVIKLTKDILFPTDCFPSAYILIDGAEQYADSSPSPRSIDLPLLHFELFKISALHKTWQLYIRDKRSKLVHGKRNSPRHLSPSSSEFKDVLMRQGTTTAHSQKTETKDLGNEHDSLSWNNAYEYQQ
jgi:hypothetical protein